MPGARPPNALAPILVGLSIIAFAIAAVMLFSTQHASYFGAFEFVPGGNGQEVQSVDTVSCLSAWNYWQGNYSVQARTLQQELQSTNANANAACTAVIHGREHLVVLLIVAAVILGGAGGFTFYARRRT